MSDQQPAMTMREIRESLGHTQPGRPEVIVSITQYAVSVLPADDINRKTFTLFVELKRDGWTVHDGHEFYAGDDTWQPSAWRAHHWPDHDDALAFAREVAPEMRVNGHTATEVWRRTQEAGQSEPVEETFCTFGEGDAPGSGCILPAGHEPANRHVVTPGDVDLED